MLGCVYHTLTFMFNCIGALSSREMRWKYAQLCVANTLRAPPSAAFSIRQICARRIVTHPKQHITISQMCRLEFIIMYNAWQLSYFSFILCHSLSLSLCAIIFKQRELIHQIFQLRFIVWCWLKYAASFGTINARLCDCEASNSDVEIRAWRRLQIRGRRVAGCVNSANTLM